MEIWVNQFQEKVRTGVEAKTAEILLDPGIVLTPRNRHLEPLRQPGVLPLPALGTDHDFLELVRFVDRHRFARGGGGAVGDEVGE